MKEAYESLRKNSANHVPLTPISFLHRTADIYGEREALIYGERSYSWRQLRERCLCMAFSLTELGVGLGDTVAVLAFNTPELFEAHFSVPMTGAVLNTINTRLDSETVSYILKFGQVKVLIVDRELLPLAQKALQDEQIKLKIILIDDDSAEVKPPVNLEVFEYEE